MPDPGFHFAEPGWLWALLVILPVIIWLLISEIKFHRQTLDRYADGHLLPYLVQIRKNNISKRQLWIGWSVLWSALVIAQAGPRWDYTDVSLFHPGASMVVLLDISQSMSVTDVKPTRLARARQEIEDLIRQNRKLRVGLIAFASLPHVVSPISEDGESIRRQLPSLSTDIVRLKGSRPEMALDRAAELLASQSEDSAQSILLVTDGDFDSRLDSTVAELANKGIQLYVLGIGKEIGGPVVKDDGSWVTDPNGNNIVSRLNTTVLSRLADTGGGIYREASYKDDDTSDILEHASRHASASEDTSQTTRIWNEKFYWLILLGMLGLLPLFRKTITQAA
ncbi:MAG: VWA domain-containing protein [Gammaproteobacteria bacterium]|nr:MAG: VWA domain-containing protein [Gammaproteobacteria bacterium]